MSLRNKKVADFCVCRVHDLRDLRVQKKYQDAAKQVLERLAENLRGVAKPSPCKQAQLDFLERAIKVNESPEPLPGGYNRQLMDVRAKRNVNTKPGLYQGLDWGQGSWPIPDQFRALVWRVGDDGKNRNHGHIATWDVRNVEIMEFAFRHGQHNLGIEHIEDLSFWDTRSVYSMRSMFLNVPFDVRVERWDTRNVTDMSSMFQGASTFNGDIGGWDTGNVKDMQQMFQGASSFNRDISGWNTRNVKNTKQMFDGALSFNGDTRGWDLQKVTDASDMFSGASDLKRGPVMPSARASRFGGRQGRKWYV